MKNDKIELFDELFSCYFSTIYHVLSEAVNRDLTDDELWELVFKTANQYGFPATTNFIVVGAIDAGKNEEAFEDKDAWPFFDRVETESNNANGKAEKTEFVNKSRLKNISPIPLSKVEKMWLKSIFSDPRIKLFVEDNTILSDLEDIDSLFDWDDFVLFDKYTDGDPYQDEHYIEMFRKVLKAVRNHSRLEIKIRKANNKLNFNQGDYCRGANKPIVGTIYIDAGYLEYSERDDKFRLVGNNPRFGRNMVNIASILGCDETEKTVTPSTGTNLNHSNGSFKQKAIFELKDDRNALERFLMNFSHYEKETEYQQDEKRYRITVFYDEADEIDVVIRVLSFGPYVKVVEPDCFVEIIHDRLQQQKKLILNVETEIKM